LCRGLRTSPLPGTHASVGDCWQNSRCCHLLSKSNTVSATPSCRTSGKEELLPTPPPLRTARAPFNASSSSIRQRPCEIRSGAAPPSDAISHGTRLPHWSWGQPERYCNRASSRCDTVVEAAPAKVVTTSPTYLLCFLTPVGCWFTPADTRGKSAPFRVG